MEKYVDHVYKKCEAILHSRLLSYDDLTTLTHSTEHHLRLFKIVVKGLADRVRNKTMPDLDGFYRYLSGNPYLNWLISINIKKRGKAIENAQIHQEAVEEMKRRWVEGEIEEQRDEEKRLRRQKAKDELRKREEERLEVHAARQDAFWEAKRVQDAANEKACLEKVRTPVSKRVAFTQDERVHWRKTRGTLPLKGC